MSSTVRGAEKGVSNYRGVKLNGSTPTALQKNQPSLKRASTGGEKRRPGSEKGRKFGWGLLLGVVGGVCGGGVWGGGGWGGGGGYGGWGGVGEEEKLLISPACLAIGFAG